MFRRALVVGVTGMVGSRLAEQLLREGFSVVGLSRGSRTWFDQIEYLKVNLLDYRDSEAALSQLRDITHVFYAARADHGEGGTEPIESNFSILRHVIELVEKYSPKLEHVHVVHGTKYYGGHLGPFKTPALEDDPRHIGQNFYYDQEDYLVSRSGKWSWSISRPALIYDFAPLQSRNPVSLIAVYGALSRASCMPLAYPGSAASFRRITEGVAACHLAKAIVWIATRKQCANKAFNVTNGDCFRWQNLWPEIAAFFVLPVGHPRNIVLADAMVDKGRVWADIVDGAKLKQNAIEDLASWSFGDYMFNQEWDLLTSTTKLALTGFREVVDSRDMLLGYFNQYRAAKIIP